MPIPLIGGIITGIVELGKTIGGGIIERSKIKAEGKIAIKKAKIEMQVNRYKQLGEMDMEGRVPVGTVQHTCHHGVYSTVSTVCDSGLSNIAGSTRVVSVEYHGYGCSYLWTKNMARSI
jgi:hypothetical protein